MPLPTSVEGPAAAGRGPPPTPPEAPSSGLGLSLCAAAAVEQEVVGPRCDSLSVGSQRRRLPMCAPRRRPWRGGRGPGHLHAGSDPGGLDESQVKGRGDGAPCVLAAWA